MNNNTDRQKQFERHLQAGEELLRISKPAPKAIFLWGLLLLIVAAAVFGVLKLWSGKPFIGTMNAMFLTLGIGGGCVFVIILVSAIFGTISDDCINYSITNMRIIYLKNDYEFWGEVSLNDIERLVQKGSNRLVVVLKKDTKLPFKTATLPNLNDVEGTKQLLLQLIKQKNDETDPKTTI